MFIRGAKPIRTIGDPDKQRPDKWNSTVLSLINITWTKEKKCSFLKHTNIVNSSGFVAETKLNTSHTEIIVYI